MSRPDFRNANQIRPPSCTIGDVTEANGSCHFSQGNTEAIASVVSEQLLLTARLSTNDDHICSIVMQLPPAQHSHPLLTARRSKNDVDTFTL